MTTQTYPRSPKSLLGGIAHLGRFIDKIRLRHEGQIQDYNYITVGFDKYLVDFLQIDPKAFDPKTGPQVKMDFRWSAGAEKADDESKTQTA